MSEKLSQEAIKVIGSMLVNGQAAKISYKIARGLYVEANRAIEAVGGQWSRSAQAHVWPDGIDVSAALDSIVFTGGYVDAKKAFGFFETPADLAYEIIRHAGVDRGKTVLEPSAGRGGLAIPAQLAGGEVTCVEIQPDNAAHLRTLGFFEVVCGDFLAEPAQPRFDIVAANPPFAKQADLDHVRHAFDFLKPGGRLVAIMSAGVSFRQNKKTADFRSWMSESPEISGGKMIANADDAFEASGTSVRTITLILDKVK